MFHSATFKPIDSSMARTSHYYKNLYINTVRIQFSRTRTVSLNFDLLFMKTITTTVCLVLISILSPFYTTLAKVDSVVVDSREVILDGKEFGVYGSYELITGTIYFTFDPANPMNKQITDLELAPRNSNGLVEASSNFVVLKPAEGRGSDVALVEVSNRGGMFTPSYFNRAFEREMDPNNEGWFGNGMVMRQGFTVIWVGWQFDVPKGNGNLSLSTPTAEYPDGSTITGKVRSDWVVDEPTNTLRLGHRNLIGYPVYNKSDSVHTLTVRDGREASRIEVPRDNWQFAREREEDEKIVSSDKHIYMESGFQTGKIYELVYKSANPPVVGIGLGVIRDVISYAKYDPNSLFPVEKGLAAGVSQTGRFLRHFLYQGFNADEQYRKAYDGLMIITAGAGRGSFNHRFAQPSRDAHRYSAFFYPTDIFPFTGKTQYDPQQWQSDGLLSHMADNSFYPKTFYINTGYEYWGRAASLIHTNVDGTADVEPMDNERIYHIASGQHFVDRFPSAAGQRIRQTSAFQGNPLEFKVNYRALLVNLKQWVTDNTQPPPSQYPRIDDGSLIKHSKLNLPEIPGIDAPQTIHVAYRTDYGPRWDDGIVDQQPPKTGDPYPSMVSGLDKFGNETAGIQNVEVRVPIATYLPWSKRIGEPGSPQEIANFRGTFAPLPLTDAAKKRRNDGRPSIESLYQSKDDYMEQVRKAARALVNRRFLLQEDIEYVTDRAERYWNWIHNR